MSQEALGQAEVAAEVAALVARAVAGEPDAWADIVRRHAGLVWSVARSHRLSDADAGDVSQTTWLRLTEHIGAIRDPSRLAAWLATTARRESLRIIASRGRELPSELENHDLPDERTPSPELTVVLDDRNSRLWSAVQTLPERCRRLLRVLASQPDLSYAEISTALGMPIGGIGPTRGRCLEQLRARVTGLDLEPVNGS